MNEKINEYTHHYALISGGKDSIAAAHYHHHNIKPLTGVLMIDTTIGLKETHDHVKAVCKKHNWKLTIIRPLDTYEDLVLKYGFPGPASHKYAFIRLKWKPIYNWLREQPKEHKIVLISGVRQKESRRRLKNVKSAFQIDQSCKRMVFYAPIYDWRTSQVWQYIKEHDLSVSPAYKTLHLSGDCLCGAFAHAGEAELIAQFYPEVADKLAKLENKCPVKDRCVWGNHSSINGAKNQELLENYFCADCQIR